MKKLDKMRLLKLLLVLLVLALVVVVGNIIIKEYQYGVSEDYYDSLRKTGQLLRRWMA